MHLYALICLSLNGEQSICLLMEKKAIKIRIKCMHDHVQFTFSVYFNIVENTTQHHLDNLLSKKLR